MATENDPSPAPAASPEAPAPQPAGAEATAPAAEAPAAAAGPLVDWATVLPQADLLSVLLLLILSFLLGSFVAANSDVWLHLAVGKSMAEGQFQFGVDPYSVATQATDAAPAVPWVHHSWLFSRIFYALYDNVLGPEVLVAVKAVGLVLLIMLLLQIRQPETPTWLLVFCTALAALCVSTRFFLNPLVVSHLLLGLTVYVLFLAGVFKLPDAQLPARPKLLWALPPLFALWANLDEWFVLGPLAVGAGALGIGIQALRQQPRPVPGRMMLAVFVVSLLACLLNPFGLRVFQLPAELAHILIQWLGPLGNVLPDSLVAGGRTLQELLQGEMSLSSLAPRYFMTPGEGLSFAGLAYFALLLLSLVALVIAALPGLKQALPPARLLLWLAFTLLAVGNFRLIPFFAIVAAPLTALTLGEIMQRRAAAGAPAPSPAASAAGRVLLLLFCVLLLFLAWPGWLHSPTWDEHPLHRVGWGIRDEPSLRRAAERAAALRSQQKLTAVFNLSPDFTYYCAWFAPGVKCFVDRRYALFPRVAAVHQDVRRTLGSPAGDFDWAKELARFGIDHVEWTTPRADYAPIWSAGARWELVYGDGRSFLLRLAARDQPVPADALVQAWSKEAFGVVPDERRAPLQGAIPPDGPVGFWASYAEGSERQPLAVSEARLKSAYFDYVSTRWKLPALLTSRIGARAQAVVTGLSGGWAVAPTTLVMGAWPLLGYQMKVGGKEEPFVPYFQVAQARDFGPPAAIVLQTRLARQAAAENPNDPGSYLAIAESYRMLGRFVEDYWTREQPGVGEARNVLRQMQTAAGLAGALRARPGVPRQHLEYVTYCQNQGYYDLALVHLMQAEKVLRRGNNPADEEMLQQVIEWREQFEAEVNRRMGDYQLKSGAAQGLEKYRWAVLGDPRHEFRIATPDNKSVIADPRGRGLVLVALKVLSEALSDGNRKALFEKSPGEFIEASSQLLRYLLLTGQVLETAQWMGELRQYLERLAPAVMINYDLFVAGAIGNYDNMLKILKVNEDILNNGARRMLQLGMSNALSSGPLNPFVNFMLVREQKQHHEFYMVQLAAAKTLRGITLLEVGDTQEARTVLREALDLAGPDLYFPDRALAERYLELLDKEHGSPKR
jgi:tetratricopeptide (TPR) repeat protein